MTVDLLKAKLKMDLAYYIQVFEDTNSKHVEEARKNTAKRLNRISECEARAKETNKYLTVAYKDGKIHLKFNKNYE